MPHKRVFGIVLVLVVLGLAACAFKAPAPPPAVDPKMLEMYDRFIEVVNRVQKDYVRDVDTKKLFENAIQGMLAGLDRFSEYVPEERLNEFKKNTLGKFGGIGIVFGRRNSLLTVISLLEDMPASKAGLLAGDVFLEVDGKNAEKMSSEEGSKLLAGDPGTTVRVKVRHLTGEVQELTITRAIIQVRTVKGLERDAKNQWVYWIDPEHKIAYVRLTQFTESSTTDLKTVLARLHEEGLKGLILDLRFDGGGLLRTATDICGMFVGEGVLVQIKARTTAFPPVMAGGKTLPFVPMAVLINGTSASASEILAGCLQDHHRAILVGERSYGKGSVQTVMSLDDDKAELKLTTAKYYLPSGRCIHREEGMTDKDEWGVMPDIAVPMTPEEQLGILFGQQEAEAPLPASGAAGNPAAPKDEKPKAETPKTDKPKAGATPSAAPEGQDGEVAADGKPPVKPIKPADDKQLQRALDVMRAATIWQDFENHEPVKVATPKPHDTKKAA
jgi:carboxyl-terminal processing protease